jgi:hypothetical protein
MSRNAEFQRMNGGVTSTVTRSDEPMVTMSFFSMNAKSSSSCFCAVGITLSLASRSFETFVATACTESLGSIFFAVATNAS